MLVIISLAFVGILAALILWMSYANYNMKASDMKAINNFYSAEMIVEQMKTGLQKDASDAMSEAYMAVLQKYSEYSVADRQAYFNTKMMTKLKNNLQGASAGSYNVTKLTGYVDTALLAGATVSSNTPGIYVMTVSTNKIVLKDVNVEYTDAKGFTSIIHTDFAITAPTMNFTDSDTLPDLFEYSLVSAKAIRGDSTGNVEIGGSVYAGTDDRSMILKGNSNWNFVSANKVIAGKSIVLEGPSASLTTDADTNTWTRNIVMEGNSSTLTLDGRSYVADDLTIDGEDDSVYLLNRYFGYGMDNSGLGDGSDSSALLINGKKTTLDLTGLDQLWIGGRSYVGTASANSADGTSTGVTVGTNVNVPMGESIAVKGDQIAYLAPVDCLGVSGNGVARVKSNPMSYTEYKSAIQDHLSEAGFVEYDTTAVIPEINEQVKNYSTSCKKIFAQGLGGQGLVYYYMVMDKESAKLYFQKYYNNRSEKLDKYLKAYADGIKTGVSANYARLDIAGNWMQYDGVGSTVSVNTPAAMNETPLISEATNYSNTFKALNAKLVTNLSNVSATELTRSVYDNLIKDTDIQAMIPTGTSATFTVGSGPTEKKAIIANEDYVYNGDAAVRVIIATGDVTVNSDFEGTIIAKGEIILGTGVKIKNDVNTRNDIGYALKAEATIGAVQKSAYEFFVDGTKYLLGGFGTTVSSGSAEDAEVSLDEVVEYENWSKR